MGGRGSGRKNRTVEVMNSMKGQQFEPKTPIATEMFLPNVSNVQDFARKDRPSSRFTKGSVLFAGTDGVPTQDNPHFFWDDANHKLGIGTITPETRIDIEDGDITLHSTTTADPTIHFLSDSPSHDFEVHLDTSATNDVLTLEGHTAGVDTEFLISALDTRAGVFHLKSGSNEAHFKMDSSGDLEILNENTDKDIVFKYTHSAEDHNLTISAEDNKLKHSTGTFDFDDDNIVTTGTLAAGVTTITGNLSTTSSLIFAGTTSISAAGEEINSLNAGDIDIAVRDNLNIYLDTNENQTDRAFRVFEGPDQNNEVFRVQEDGKVGIGTTSPDTLVNLAGTNSGSNRNVVLRLEDTDATVVDGDLNGAIEFFNNDNNVLEESARIESRYAGGAGTTDLHFMTGSGGTLTDSMTILNSGLIGMGRTNPQTILHIESEDPVIRLQTKDAAINATEVIGSIDMFGTDTTERLGASIRFIADASWGADVDDAPTAITFHTETDGGTSAFAERMRITSDGDVQIKTGDLKVEAGFINLGSVVELTVAAGVVTATQTYHQIDTQDNDTTDDLDTINGGTEGDLLILKSANSSRDTTLKDGSGNMNLVGDFILTSVHDRITLLFDGTTWKEISRSNNG